MNLHPQVIDLINRVKEAGVRPTHELTPQEAREQMEEMSKVRDQERTEVGAIEDRVVPGPAGNIPVRVYRSPHGGLGPQPALMFFHGGGHVVGSIESHDLVARNLCVSADCTVVSVDYRLGPEDPFPAAPEDCFAATRSVSENAATMGIDPARIAVGGDSAGGNLAAVVALMARENPADLICVFSCWSIRSPTMRSIPNPTRHLPKVRGF